MINPGWPLENGISEVLLCRDCHGRENWYLPCKIGRINNRALPKLGKPKVSKYLKIEKLLKSFENTVCNFGEIIFLFH